jgi:hypothetical protein
MLLVNQLISYTPVDVSSSSISYLGMLSTVSGNTVTGSIDIGSADANREIFLVGVTSAGLLSASMGSSSIAGTAPTKATNERTTSGGTISCCFATIPSASGAQTITLGYSGPPANGRVFVYRVLNRPGIGGNQNDYQGTDSVLGATSASLSSVTIPNDGFWIGGHLHNNTAATTPPASPIIEDEDVIVGSIRSWGGHSPVQVTGSTPTTTWSWTPSAAHVTAAWSFG